MFPRAKTPERALRAPWSGLLSLGWIAIGIALVVVGATSRQIGKPSWWLGDGVPTAPTVLWVVPLVGPFCGVVASRATTLWALGVSTAASAGLAAIAVGDLNASPGAATSQFVLAGAGVLLTAAASAGRPTRRALGPSR